MTISIYSKRFRVHARLAAILFVAAIAVALMSFIHRGPSTLETNRVINITADIFCMVLGLVLFLCCGSDTQWDQDNLNYFLMMIITTFVAAFTDEYSWLVDGKANLIVANKIVNTIYYCTAPGLGYLFWRYVITFLNVEKERTYKWDRFFFIGLSLSILLRIGNIFFGYYFSVDANGVYARERFYPISMFYGYFTLVMTLLLVIRARKRFEKFQVIALFCYALLPMSVGILTIVFYGLSLSSPVIMMVFMLMYCVLNVVQSRKRSVEENEMHLATAIQETVLPRNFPDRTDFDIYASMIPAKDVGGDFYDFFLLDEDHLAMVIADVSGKGIPAALYMMVSKTMIKNQTMAIPKSPSEVLSKVNDQLMENNKAEMFVTAWVGVLNLKSGELVYANAGHEYPVIKHRGGSYEILREKHSPPLGCLEDIPFREGKMTLQKGDVLFVYTDGVTEATNVDEQLFGTERMLQVLNSSETDEPVMIEKTVREGIGKFAHGAPQFDDITMLCMRYDGKDR